MGHIPEQRRRIAELLRQPPMPMPAKRIDRGWQKLGDVVREIAKDVEPETKAR